MARISQNTEWMKIMAARLHDIKTDVELPQEWADGWWRESCGEEYRCPITGYMIRDLKPWDQNKLREDARKEERKIRKERERSLYDEARRDLERERKAVEEMRAPKERSSCTTSIQQCRGGSSSGDEYCNSDSNSNDSNGTTCH